MKLELPLPSKIILLVALPWALMAPLIRNIVVLEDCVVTVTPGSIVRLTFSGICMVVVMM